MTPQNDISRQRRSPMGKIEVAPRAIASIAARAASQCEGVLGMAPHTLHEGAAQVLQQRDAHRGVELRIGHDTVAVELYVVLEYGAHIAEVARNTETKVRQALEHALGMPVAQVQVRVQGLRSN